jgi:hypothetical protein
MKWNEIYCCLIIIIKDPFEKKRGRRSSTSLIIQKHNKNDINKHRSNWCKITSRHSLILDLIVQNWVSELNRTTIYNCRILDAICLCTSRRSIHELFLFLLLFLFRNLHIKRFSILHSIILISISRSCRR